MLSIAARLIKVSHSLPTLSRSIGRRNALKLGGLGALGLLAGCTSATGPVTLPDDAASGRPAEGGTLRIARPAIS